MVTPDAMSEGSPRMMIIIFLVILLLWVWNRFDNHAVHALYSVVWARGRGRDFSGGGGGWIKLLPKASFLDLFTVSPSLVCRLAYVHIGSYHIALHTYTHSQTHRARRWWWYCLQGISLSLSLSLILIHGSYKHNYFNTRHYCRDLKMECLN